MSVFNTKIKSLKILAQGKVRDIYKIDEEKILIISTDRVSAFDTVLRTPIPDRGIILNKMSEFWMKKFSPIIQNHLTGKSPSEFLTEDENDEVFERSVVAKNISPIPVEAVVRSRITGTAWQDYLKTGEVCGIKLPANLKEGDKLDYPIFTPARKAPQDDHDENISFQTTLDEFGTELTTQIKEKSLSLFNMAYDFLATKKIVLVDTKFEFGLNNKGELTLIDEVITPDSSRFFLDNTYYDKQLIRNFLKKNDLDPSKKIIDLPESVVIELGERYRKIYSLVSGKKRPIVSVVMGSESDWEIMSNAVNTLKDFNVELEYKVVSAHRMPDDLYNFAEEAQARGILGIIAGAGGAAHLPGMLAAKTTIPIFGVPIPSKHLNGEDSLFSIVQMPKGVPVATFAIGKSGATNAALHLVSILSLNDSVLRSKLKDYRLKQRDYAKSMNFNLGQK